jgi:hypothetical protein
MNRTPTERPPSTGDERGVLPPTRMECAERVEGPHHMEAVMGPDDYVICRNTKATDAHEAARDLDNQVDALHVALRNILEVSRIALLQHEERTAIPIPDFLRKGGK